MRMVEQQKSLVHGGQEQGEMVNSGKDVKKELDPIRVCDRQGREKKL